MCSFVFVILTIWCSLLQSGFCQSEDFCQTPRTGQGVCKSIYECPQALADLSYELRPQVCGYLGRTAIVCCPLPVPTLPSSSPAPEYQNHDKLAPAPEYQNHDKLAPVTGAKCHSVPCDASRVQNNGQKPWDSDVCRTPRNEEGVCKSIRECPQVVAEYNMNGLPPKVCGYTGEQPLVCCPLPVPTLPSSSPPPEYDYDDIYPIPGSKCHSIPRNASRVQKNGQKAWDQCIGHLQYVYPCQLAETLSAREDMARRYDCGHSDLELAYGTHVVKSGEIPHMVLLGYGSSVKSASWACAGTIIHENYILTAASCLAKGSDAVRFVRVGLVNISSSIDERRVFNVSQFISNPQYNQRRGYHNIGLIRTATPITSTRIYQVYPACLHTGNTVDDGKMMAAGWGLADFGGTSGSRLRKVTLNKLESGDCIVRGRTRRLPKSEICAGYPAYTSDTCQVDVGSPLQIFNPDVDCMYIVLGVASVGPKCGPGTEHGIFTRVSPHIRWIESIVWP